MTQKSLIGLLTVGALALSMPRAGGANHAHLPSLRGVCEVRASVPGRMKLFVPTVSEKGKKFCGCRRPNPPKRITLVHLVTAFVTLLHDFLRTFRIKTL